MRIKKYTCNNCGKKSFSIFDKFKALSSEIVRCDHCLKKFRGTQPWKLLLGFFHGSSPVILWLLYFLYGLKIAFILLVFLYIIVLILLIHMIKMQRIMVVPKFDVIDNLEKGKAKDKSSRDHF